MATVYLTFTAGERIRKGGESVIAKGSFGRSEAVTSSGTSAASTFTAKPGETMVKVFCDTALAVNTGDSPTASLATGIYVAAGQTEWVSIETGHQVAVIDV